MSHLRTATAADVHAIVAFGADVVAPHYTPLLGASAARAQLSWWTPERMAPAVAAGRVHVAVADDSDVLGVCESGVVAGEQVVWKLYLAPRVRGRGLGTELLRHAIAALPAGTDHVLVAHVAGNTRAGDFYERAGFAVLDAGTPSPGDPAAVLVWRRLELG